MWSTPSKTLATRGSRKLCVSEMRPNFMARLRFFRLRVVRGVVRAFRGIRSLLFCRGFEKLGVLHCGDKEGAKQTGTEQSIAKKLPGSGPACGPRCQGCQPAFER